MPILIFISISSTNEIATVWSRWTEEMHEGEKKFTEEPWYIRCTSPGEKFYRRSIARATSRAMSRATSFSDMLRGKASTRTTSICILSMSMSPQISCLEITNMILLGRENSLKTYLAQVSIAILTIYSSGCNIDKKKLLMYRNRKFRLRRRTILSILYNLVTWICVHLCNHDYTYVYVNTHVCFRSTSAHLSI
jgi:hypothetical protein